ncbi:hypothetical protein LUPAC06_04545 [Micromonospora saelicesensis]|nr:hypothetical protein LUPAC06_04545 [Micromonospora saelicesensis]
MVVDDFTTEIDGVTSAAGMVSTTWSESTGSSVPVGVPCAVAMSVSSSWSRSAWVTVYVAAQTVVAPGARVVCGQVIGPRFAFDDGGSCTSVMLTLFRVTPPVLATRKL